MKRTFIIKGIFACIATLLTVATFAQTIKTGTVTPASICAGNKISVAFTVTGTIPAGTVFTAELSGATGIFTAPVAVGTGIASPISATIPAASISGTGYRVRIVGGTTPEIVGSASAAFTVNAIPAAPTVADKNYKVGDVAELLSKSVIETGLKWYDAATGGNALAGDPIPSTATAGTQTYYVSQTSAAGCESSRSKINVIITACTPPAPPVVKDVKYCLGSTAQVLSATGKSLKWYTTATVATGSSTAPTPSTAKAGTTSYYVSQTIDCESPRARIDVVVTETAAPVVDKDPVEYCINEKPSALTATGTSLKWYTSATSETGVSAAPTPLTTVAGTKSYYVSQTLNGCESERAEIKVVVKPTSSLPAVNATVINLCQNSTAAPLTANGTAGAVFKWYTVATGGTALASAPVPVTTTAGTTSYYVSQVSANSCEGSRVKVDVVIKDTPAAPKVTSLAYCEGAKATALTPSGPLYKWYTVATGGTVLATPPTPQTAAARTTSYYLTQSNTYPTQPVLSCESPRAKLDVVINPTPTPITVTAEVFCQERESKIFPFPIKAASGNAMRWYTTASGSDTTKAKPSINLNTAGIATYYATQVTAKGCESPARVIQSVRVKPLPAAPGVDKPVIEYCQFVPAEPLKATWVNGAVPNWYGSNPTGGTPSATAPVPSTQEGGTTSYYVGQTLEGCVSDRAKIDVKINTTPKPKTTTYLAYCQGESAPRLDATGTILKWYRAATDTEFQGFPYTPFTEKVQDYSFYVTQTGTENGCESPKEEIRIHIKALPTAVISGNTTIDLGQTASIMLKFTGEGPWIYALSNGITDTTDQATTSVTVRPSTTTSYYVTDVSNSCGKGTPNGLAVVTVKIPTISSGTPSVSEACAGKNFSVPFQQSGDFPAGNRFNVQISLLNDDDAFYTIPSIATTNLVTATFPDTTTGGNYFVRVVSSGDNEDLIVKGSVSAVGIAASPLPVATLSGSQTILAGGSATLKVEFTGKSPWSFTLNNGTKDSLITANTTPFSFKIASPATTTYTISSVSNVCGEGKGAGSARVQVDPILGVEPPVLSSDWLNVYPTVVDGQCTIEITGAFSSKEASVQVIDMNGRRVLNQQIRQKTTSLDFSGYSSGLYLLRVQNGNLNSLRKIMKP